MERYDLAVIGAGSAGLVAALTANRAGKRVAMLEKNKSGGECTHSGCIPSKAFISSARMFHAMNTVEAMGLASVHTGYFSEGRTHLRTPGRRHSYQRELLGDPSAAALNRLPGRRGHRG